MSNIDITFQDYSRITESFELEWDNSCHFANIVGSYESGMVWKMPEQHVYSPIFGNNLESTGTDRDISLWLDTKALVYISRDSSAHIWADRKDFTTKIVTNNIYPAYCNLDVPLCALDKSEIRNQEVIQAEFNKEFTDRTHVPPITAPYIIRYEIHKPAKANKNKRYPVVILVPDRTADRSMFNQQDSITGVADTYKYTSQGYITVTFDPDGRGLSGFPNGYSTGIYWNPPLEDYGGMEHQETLKLLIDEVRKLNYIDLDNIGIVAHGFGLIMTVGALSRYKEDLSGKIKYVIDVEGDLDKNDIAGCDDGIGWYKSQDCNNTDWWHERSATTYIKDLSCYYWRIQTLPFKASAIGRIVDYINTTLRDESSKAFWMKINEEPVNRTFEYSYVPVWHNTSAKPLKAYLFSIINKLANMPNLNYYPVTSGYKSVVGLGDTETSCDVFDDLISMDSFCETPAMIKKSRIKTLIVAQRLRGYYDANGECPNKGAMAFLCDRRGFDLNIRSLHGDTKNRLKSNINTTLLNLEHKMFNNILCLHFDDEYTQLDGSTRKYSKFRTNIRVHKPLKYQLRLSPALSDIKSGVFSTDSQYIQISKGSYIYTKFELPIYTNVPNQTSFRFVFAYSPLNPVPPADVMLRIVPQNEASRTAFPLIDFNILTYKSFKLPLCIYNKEDDVYYMPVNDTEQYYPMGTFGWGMKEKIQFAFINPTVAPGIYTYNMVFYIRMASIFGEIGFGDFFGFTQYENIIPLQINVSS